MFEAVRAQWTGRRALASDRPHRIVVLFGRRVVDDRRRILVGPPVLNDGRRLVLQHKISLVLNDTHKLSLQILSYIKFY